MPSAYALEVLARLPAIFRAYDTDGVTVGLVDGAAGGDAQAVDELVARIQRLYPDEAGYVPGDTSDLVDPTGAPADWLAWIAMVYGIHFDRAGGPSFAGTYGQLGVDYATYAVLDAAFGTYSDQEAGTTPPPSGLSEAEQRAAIAALAGWRAGSTDAIRMLVQQYLTGTRAVTVARSYGGNWARVRLITYAAETPYPWKVAEAIARPDVAPATVELLHVVYAGASYADLDAGFGTYADMDAALGTYADTTSWIPA